MFEIDSDKLSAVQTIVQAAIPEATDDQVETFVLADWAEGQEHQDWLDTASAEEIAGWVIISHSHGEFDEEETQ